MSNASNVGIPRHSLGEAIERLRDKWAAIAAFGVLLVVLGCAALFFALFATIVDGDAQRRSVPDRRRGRDRHRHAFARRGGAFFSG